MDFRAIARDCRTIRRFDEERRISGEDMLSIIDAARVVPSAGNRQPLKYMAIRDREGCDALFPHLAWAAALRDWDGPAPGERPAAYIVMLIDKDISFNAATDAGIAGYALMLAAHGIGIGSCIIGSVSRPKVYRLLGIDPERFDIPLVVALGYPKEASVLEEASGSIDYYRTADGVHHVPKMPLGEVLLS